MSLALLTSVPTVGGLILTLTNPGQYGLPRTTLYVSGHLTNDNVDAIDPGTGDPIPALTLFPNGDDINLISVKYPLPG